MLLLTFQKEGGVMQEPRQLDLFETVTRSWILRVWETVDDERRQQVVAILAEMANEMTRAKTTQEQDHAPR